MLKFQKAGYPVCLIVIFSIVSLPVFSQKPKKRVSLDPNVIAQEMKAEAAQNKRANEYLNNQNRLSASWYSKAENYLIQATADPCNKALEAEVAAHLNIGSNAIPNMGNAGNTEYQNWLQKMLPQIEKYRHAFEQCPKNTTGFGGSGSVGTKSGSTNNLDVADQQAQLNQVAESLGNAAQRANGQFMKQAQEMLDNASKLELGNTKKEQASDSAVNQLVRENENELDYSRFIQENGSNPGTSSIQEKDENQEEKSPGCDLGPTLDFYYYSVEFTITNNTDSKIQAIPGIDFGCFTLGDDDNELNIPPELCCSNYYDGHPADRDKDDKFYLNSIIEPKGAFWNWNFWCNHPIPENILWSFNYDFYSENSSLDVKADKENTSAKLRIGPDPKPVKTIVHGLQPNGKVLFDDGKVAFSYNLKLVRTCNDCYTRMVLDSPCGFHSERCKRCCHKHTHGCGGVK